MGRMKNSITLKILRSIEVDGVDGVVLAKFIQCHVSQKYLGLPSLRLQLYRTWVPTHRTIRSHAQKQHYLHIPNFIAAESSQQRDGDISVFEKRSAASTLARQSLHIPAKDLISCTVDQESLPPPQKEGHWTNETSLLLTAYTLNLRRQVCACLSYIPCVNESRTQLPSLALSH